MFCKYWHTLTAGEHWFLNVWCLGVVGLCISWVHFFKRSMSSVTVCTLEGPWDGEDRMSVIMEESDWLREVVWLRGMYSAAAALRTLPLTGVYLDVTVEGKRVWWCGCGGFLSSSPFPAQAADAACCVLRWLWLPLPPDSILNKVLSSIPGGWEPAACCSSASTSGLNRPVRVR